MTDLEYREYVFVVGAPGSGSYRGTFDSGAREVSPFNLKPHHGLLRDSRNLRVQGSDISPARVPIMLAILIRNSSSTPSRERSRISWNAPVCLQAWSLSGRPALNDTISPSMWPNLGLDIFPRSVSTLALPEPNTSHYLTPEHASTSPPSS